MCIVNQPFVNLKQNSLNPTKQTEFPEIICIKCLFYFVEHRIDSDVS